MRKLNIIFVTIFFLSYSNTSYSQTINGIKLVDLQAQYLSVFVEDPLFSNKFTIIIDYGQDRSQQTKTRRIYDTNNNEIKFNSVADILNFLHTNSYKLFSKNSIVFDNIPSYEYLFEKIK